MSATAEHDHHEGTHITTPLSKAAQSIRSAA